MLAVFLSTAVAGTDPVTEARSPEDLVVECERFEHGDPARAIDLAQQAEEALNNQPDPVLLHRTLGCRAWALTSQGRTLEAGALLGPMAALLEQLIEPSDQVRGLRRKAALYHRIGDIATSTDTLGRALEVAEQHDLRSLRIDLLTNMGVFHSEAEQHDLAIQYYYRALDLREPGDEPHQQLPILFNLGLTYRGAGDLDSASKVLARLIEPLQEPGMEIRLASLLMTLGAIEQQRGELDAAEDYFSRSAALHEQLENPSEYASLLISKSGLHLARGAVDQALVRSGEAMELARKSEHHFTIRNAMRARSNALVAAGRHDEAVPLEQERAMLSEQYQREQQRSRLNELEAELGVAWRERELVELRRTTDLQLINLQQQVQRQQNGMVLVIAFVVLGMGLIIWQRSHNRRLRHLSRTDLLTGLSNRRHMTEILAGAGENGRMMVILLDLDNFKQINDDHGHDLGDRALVALSGCLRQFVRERDGKVGRWGGEEFLLLIPERRADRAARLAGELLERVARVEVVRASGPSLQFTASLGFTPLTSTARHSGQNSWEPALLIADHMMYRAKQAGRNRYCGAWPTGPETALHPHRLEKQVESGDCQLLEGPGGQGKRVVP